MNTTTFLFKQLPIILALLVWGITYHTMSIYTEKMWTYPEIYCKLNALPTEYNTCTKFVVVGGYTVFILPLGMTLGTFLIVKNIQKKEKDLIINEK